MRSLNSLALTDMNRSSFHIDSLENKQKNKQKKCFIKFLIQILFLEQREKPDDTVDDPLGEFEMSKVTTRKQQRTGIKTNSTPYSSNEVNIH
jgi:hypothetical protein